MAHFWRLMFCRLLLLVFFFLGICPSQAGFPIITSVDAARSLSFAEASSGREVCLEGVATYVRDASPQQFNFNLNDPTGGVMVYPSEWVSLSPGQKVRVEGRTEVSIHGLRVAATKIELGPIGMLPVAHPVVVEELHLRENVGRYVQVDATLRSSRLELPVIKPQRLALDLGPVRDRVTAWIIHFDASSRAWIPGVRLRLKGVPLHWTNARGQTQSVSLMMNSTTDLEVISPPVTPEPMPLGEVLLWNRAARDAERMATSGVVTMHRPGELVVIQDGQHAIRIRPMASEALGVPPSVATVGDRVEVYGFPAMGEYTTELEDSEVRASGVRDPVLPTEYADAAVLLADSSLVDLDGRLVRLKGTLRGVQKQENLCVLEIDSGGVFLAASFPWEEGLPQLMRPGSVVALTGVCNLHLSEQRRRLGRTPNQMSLILQDSRELSLIKAAPWWDRTRLLNALAIAAALATLAGLWAAHASRRNSRLKQEIARREAAESRLSMERTRVAGDLHDTLEQTLLAADLQLSAAARSLEVQPKAVSSRLALVGQLLSRGRQEVREAVWDLHVGGGKPQPLGHLLNAACRDAAAAATAKIEFDGPQEEEPLLPAPLSAQLIRVVRESMTNALKHGAPKRVAVRLRYNSSQIEVTISDDGLGFSPEKAMGPASGHFGLSGMRERIQRLGGEFAIRSTPGMGVDVVLSVPIATS